MTFSTPVASKPPLIRIENVSKRFGALAAVDRVTLDIEAGEFFVLLGPSGCGKTTLLRMLAGFEVPDTGRILIDGVDMAGVPPNKRPVNMVFQSYAVFPHMSVADNVAYGLKIARTDKSELSDRVAAALALVKMEEFAGRMPDQLSGGQRQRVALARSLVMQPKVLLLDEPLSALDAKLRTQMQFELADMQDEVGITFVTVTHDQDEALSMACRIGVMNKGEIAQLASPSDLYEFPATRFVADFIGTVNLFEGQLIVDQPDHAVADCNEIGRVFIDHGVTGPHDAPLWIAIRPEKIAMAKPGRYGGRNDVPAGHNQTEGVIKSMSYLGDITLYEVRLASGRILHVSRPNISRTDQEAFTWDDPVALHWHGSSPVVLLA